MAHPLDPDMTELVSRAEAAEAEATFLRNLVMALRREHFISDRVLARVSKKANAETPATTGP